MQAPDEPGLREILGTDPFWVNGIIDNLLVLGWDPVFGRLATLSSAPDGLGVDDV